MQVMLIQNIHNLGRIGDRVDVKPGYARNFLLPKGLAVRITAANLEAFEKQRADLEKAAATALANSKERAETIKQLAAVTIKVRVASEDKLYGSVGVKDIVGAIENTGIKIEPREVCMPEGAIRTLGEYTITLQFAEEITAELQVKLEPEES